jgi:hypothetical protein
MHIAGKLVTIDVQTNGSNSGPISSKFDFRPVKATNARKPIAIVIKALVENSVFPTQFESDCNSICNKSYEHSY